MASRHFLWMALTSLALAACGGSADDLEGAGARDEAVAQGFLNDPEFRLAPFDTGNVGPKCLVQAPWGSRSWGIEASTFSDPDDHALAGARFAANGDQIYFYGKEDDGRWGFVRFIQGNLWGGTNCGATPWFRPEPVPTFGRELEVDLAVYRDTTRLTSWYASWAMLALNVWFSSPDLPEKGGDVNHRKPIVMDLIFHHECNTPLCGYGNYVDDAAYHYQAFIGEAPAHEWASFSVQLSDHLRAAIDAFGIPGEAERTMKLHQLEILFELKNAEGAASVDRLELVER